jgi:heme/copper-type cytochrome/quinol oxidase subunit 3
MHFFCFSINYFLQVPPSLEGVELVEQKLLEKDYEEVFSLFTTLHNVHVLIIFVLLKLILSPLV